MKLLIITDSIPYPPISGDRVRTYHLTRRIADRHQVWLATLLERPEEEAGVEHMRTFCAGVEYAHLHSRPPLAHLPRLTRFMLAGHPPELAFQHSEELVKKVRRLVAEVDFDLVQIEHSHMGLYREILPAGLRCKTVLVFHNLASEQYRRLAQVNRAWGPRARFSIHSRLMRRWEPRLAERFDQCLMVSELELQALREARPSLKRLAVVPNGVDTRAYQPLPRQLHSPVLLFLGTMSYPACSDAALYFSTEILPTIRERIGDVRLRIVGADPPPQVCDLEGPSITVTGRVEQVLPHYAQSSLCVVPLRAGGGTRLKILEAMALGRPVISTSLGCEGLQVEPGVHLLVADTPEQFAEETVRLLTDERLYDEIAHHARQRVVERYDWDQISATLLGIYDELAESAVSTAQALASQETV